MIGEPSRTLAPLKSPVSGESGAIVRSLYEAFSRLARGGDVASYVTTHFDPECEYRPVEEMGTVRGHDALIRWIDRWLEAWNDAWDRLDEIFEVRGLIIARITVHGRGRMSGMEISQRLFDLFELRDGRILRITEYLDSAEAFQAARAVGSAGIPAPSPTGARLSSGRPGVRRRSLKQAPSRLSQRPV